MLQRVIVTVMHGEIDKIDNDVVGIYGMTMFMWGMPSLWRGVSPHIIYEL